VKYVSLFIAIVCAVFNLNAQELPPIQYFSPSEYQAGNQNWMIAESADHRIFIANNKGLLEYNGAQWRLYK